MSMVILEVDMAPPRMVAFNPYAVITIIERPDGRAEIVVSKGMVYTTTSEPFETVVTRFNAAAQDSEAGQGP